MEPATVQVDPSSAVRIVQGNPAHWALKVHPRVTCRECGTRMLIDIIRLSLRGVNGYLLGVDFKPSFHMNCKFAVRPVRDDLPHFAGRPARFGGSDETVTW